MADESVEVVDLTQDADVVEGCLSNRIRGIRRRARRRQQQRNYSEQNNADGIVEITLDDSINNNQNAIPLPAGPNSIQQQRQAVSSNQAPIIIVDDDDEDDLDDDDGPPLDLDEVIRRQMLAALQGTPVPHYTRRSLAFRSFSHPPRTLNHPYSPSLHRRHSRSHRSATTISTASSMADIEQSTTPRRTPSPSPRQNELKCPICIETYVDIKRNGVKIVVTRCGHMFCDVCLKKSLTDNGRKCPKCRKNVPKSATGIIEIFDVA